MALIELNNVSKRFGRLIVLRHLDIKIEKGHCIVVIGASGTGKSVQGMAEMVRQAEDRRAMPLRPQLLAHENALGSAGEGELTA